MFIDICIITAMVIGVGLVGMMFGIRDMVKDRKEIKRIKDAWLY